MLAVATDLLPVASHRQVPPVCHLDFTGHAPNLPPSSPFPQWGTDWWLHGEYSTAFSWQNCINDTIWPFLCSFSLMNNQVVYNAIQ